MIFHSHGAALLLAAGLLFGTAGFSIASAQTDFTPTGTINSYAPLDTSATNHDVAPRIAHNGAELWLAVWLDENGRGALEFSRSDDGGITWDALSVLDVFKTDLIVGEQDLANPFVESAELAYAGESTWVVVWHIREDESQESRHYICASTSTDNGHTWSPSKRLNRDGVALDEFRDIQTLNLTSDRMGNLIVSWGYNVESLFYDTTLSRSSDGGQTWTLPEFVPAVQHLDQWHDRARLTYLGNNRWLMAFAGFAGPSKTELGIYTAASTDNGQTWNLHGPHVEDIELEVLHVDVQGYNNNVVVSYYEGVATVPPDFTDSRGNVHVITSTDGGETFGLPVTVDSDQPHSRSIVPERHLTYGAGTWLLNYGLQDADGFLSGWRSNDPGTSWERVRIVSAGLRMSDGIPTIAGDDSGKLVCVFSRVNRNLSVEHQDADILAVASHDGGATWTGTTYVNSNHDNDYTKVSDILPELVAGENGTVLATWRGGTSDSDVTAIMYARSEDNGQTWGDATCIAESPYSSRLDYAGSGTWIISIDFRGHLISTDNGLTWNETTQFEGWMVTMETDKNGTVIRQLVGSNEEHYTISHDNGATWQKLAIPESSRPYRVIHTGGTNWFALNDHSETVTSNNGGLTWTYRGTNHELATFGFTQVQSDREGNVVAYIAKTDRNPDESFTISVYVSNSADHGLTWSPPTLLQTKFHGRNGNGTAPGFPYTELKSIALVSGKWQLYWKYRFQHINPGMPTVAYSYLYRSVSMDSGQTWSRPESLSADIPIETITAAGENVIHAWSAQSPEGDYDIYYKTISNPVTAAADWQLFE